MLPARAAPLTATDVLTQFNAVITGNFASTADVEGRTLVGGNVTRGATFFGKPGDASPSSASGLTVFGDVTSSGSMSVNNGGGATIGGTSSAIINANGGGTVTTGAAASLPDFGSTFRAPLLALSSALARLPTDSSLPSSPPGFPNNVPVTASAGTGMAVFRITADQLDDYASFRVNLNGRSGAIFNVSGASYTGNANFLNALAVARDIIWNFTEATSLAFNTQWGGTVLAPLATVTNSTPIEGTLFAASYVGSGELHSQPFRQALPPATLVPEPASIMLYGLGLAWLLTARRRSI
jgi:choice-of-anchor A domain-containing protein